MSARAPMPPTDPLIYRFYELIMCNGPARRRNGVLDPHLVRRSRLDLEWLSAAGRPINLASASLAATAGRFSSVVGSKADLSRTSLNRHE